MWEGVRVLAPLFKVISWAFLTRLSTNSSRDLEIIVGTAAATFPISSSLCIIFLTLACWKINQCLETLVILQVDVNNNYRWKPRAVLLFLLGTHVFSASKKQNVISLWELKFPVDHKFTSLAVRKRKKLWASLTFGQETSTLIFYLQPFHAPNNKNRQKQK